MSGAAAQVVSLLTMVMTSTSPGLIRQTWFAGDCDYLQELALCQGWDTLSLEKKIKMESLSRFIKTRNSLYLSWTLEYKSTQVEIGQAPNHIEGQLGYTVPWLEVT